MSLGAEELKNKGNEYFKNQQYAMAISMYSQAIEQNGNVAVYYANRANAYFQDGSFKAAEDDAMKAIEIDDKYMKAYWRMAEVSRCVGKPQEALSWYKKAHDLEPKNKKIAEQLIAMHQIVKMQQESKKNILAGLGGYESRFTPVTGGGSPMMPQYNSMNRLFSSPFGASGSAPTTVSEIGRDFEISDNLQETYKTVDERIDFLERFYKYCSDSKVLHSEQLKKLVIQSAGSLNKFQTFNRVTFKETSQITVVGDLHGSRSDFMKLFGDICALKTFMKSEDYLIILGDFVDRGSDGHQILCFAAALQLMCPERVYLIRGNHETPALNGFFGYQSQLETFYGTSVCPTGIIAPLFQSLPLLLIVDQKDRRYAFFHGGLPVAMSDVESLDDLFKQMPAKALEPSDPISQQLLWSDPMHEQSDIEIKPSHRGVGYIYSQKAYTTMRQKLGISVSFRGHEMVMGQIGLRDDFGDQTHYTVFSSSDYVGQPNIGAVAIIKDGNISPCPLK